VGMSLITGRRNQFSMKWKLKSSLKTRAIIWGISSFRKYDGGILSKRKKMGGVIEVNKQKVLKSSEWKVRACGMK